MRVIFNIFLLKFRKIVQKISNTLVSKLKDIVSLGFFSIVSHRIQFGLELSSLLIMYSETIT